MLVNLDLSDYFAGCKFPSESRPAKSLTGLFEYSPTIKIGWWWVSWSYSQFSEWYYESIVINEETGANWDCYEGGQWVEYFNGFYRLGGPGACILPNNGGLLCEHCPQSNISFASPPSIIVEGGYIWQLGPVEVDISAWQISISGGPAMRSHEAEVILPPNETYPDPPSVWMPNPHCSGNRVILTGSYIPWWTYVEPGVGFLPHNQPMRVFWLPSDYAYIAWQYTRIGPVPHIPKAALPLSLILGATVFARRGGL